MEKKRKRGVLGSIILVLATIVAVVAAALLFLFYTSAGRQFTSKMVASYLHGSITYVSEEGESSSEVGTGQDDTKESEKEVYHVLLLGEEALNGTAGKGRTDAILLVTIHTGNKEILVTSVLRDTYVEPEGTTPCKINAVYAKQGVQGLYRILEEKLGIRSDGYVKVGFDSFEKMIDLLGGAEVTLTAEEAEYLNTHNYISKEEYRNVHAGTQVLNGNQTLGYCRVRYVANCNGTQNDYGRTERQRMVLENLFERYKEAGVMKWTKILKEGLGYIETDISEKTLEQLIFAVYDNKITAMKQHQLPAKGTYESPTAVGNVTSPLVVDWEKNKELLLEYSK